MLIFSDNNNVTGNTINNNIYGIYLYYSNYNNVTSNTLKGNEFCITDDNCMGNFYKDNGPCEVRYIRTKVSGVVSDDDDADEKEKEDDIIPILSLVFIVVAYAIAVIFVVLFLIKKKKILKERFEQ